MVTALLSRAVAMIVIVPFLRAVIRPLEEIVALETSDDDHATVLLLAFVGKTSAVICPLKPEVILDPLIIID